MKIRSSLLIAVLVVSVGACASTPKPESKSITLAESADGDGFVVTISEALALSLLEDVVGSEIECGAELDSDFAGLLRELDREGRGGRATLRDGDGVLTARRSGRSLKLSFDDRDGGGLEAKMPWTVAECLLDGSTTLTALDAGAIKVKIVGSEGGSFEIAVD